ncbi:hypothetical protein P389DRAFT_91007 [Cystobasidium minutum MCA 4210]|uniref:uncharacterized protein n=1 Tax=Cystobasidium minutum MCA 4210 TaxID=1397322 RepID=UPI0034CE4AA8|eukprot:jgi/Rhomi1/91007/CE91006_82
MRISRDPSCGSCFCPIQLSTVTSDNHVVYTFPTPALTTNMAKKTVGNKVQNQPHHQRAHLNQAGHHGNHQQPVPYLVQTGARSGEAKGTLKGVAQDVAVGAATAGAGYFQNKAVDYLEKRSQAGEEKTQQQGAGGHVDPEKCCFCLPNNCVVQ